MLRIKLRKPDYYSSVGNWCKAAAFFLIVLNAIAGVNQLTTRRSGNLAFSSFRLYCSVVSVATFWGRGVKWMNSKPRRLKPDPQRRCYTLVVRQSSERSDITGFDDIELDYCLTSPSIFVRKEAMRNRKLEEKLTNPGEKKPWIVTLAKSSW